MFFGTQNINLNSNDNGLGDFLGDLGSLNDDDSYKFRVKDTGSSDGLNTNVNDLEKLNTYHSTFNEPKKTVHYLELQKVLNPLIHMQIQQHIRQSQKDILVLIV